MTRPIGTIRIADVVDPEIAERAPADVRDLLDRAEVSLGVLPGASAGEVLVEMRENEAMRLLVDRLKRWG